MRFDSMLMDTFKTAHSLPSILDFPRDYEEEYHWLDLKPCRVKDAEALRAIHYVSAVH